MKKSKERLAAEASMQMTWRQRVDNFWFYYKWVVLGGIGGTLLLMLFVHDMLTNVKPDYSIGVLTPRYVTEETRAGLEQVFTDYADDLNGDGKVAVSVQVYQIGLSDETATDPTTHMAMVTKLSADMQTAESILFLTDELEQYQKTYGLFAYNDGVIPAEGEAADMTRMGVALTDCAALKAFLAAPHPEDLSGMRLVKRAVAPELLEKKKEVSVRWAASNALYERLLRGELPAAPMP